MRRLLVACLTVVGLSLVGASAGPAVGGDDGKKPPPPPDWLLDRALEITPQGEPVPALKYRLFPATTDLKDGNAVPIYLRLVFEQSEKTLRWRYETPVPWNQLPLDQLPRDKVRGFLTQNRRFLQQMQLGARRKTADWNYTLDEGDPIGILLPDAQTMRNYTHVLVLKARFEIAEGHYAAAADWLATGFAFSRHVAEGPFLINGLVGIAIASQFEDAVLDFIGRPGAPNLYWALSVLPRPLIDLRKEEELEQALLEMQFPELADLKRERTPAQWDALLKRFRTEVERIVDSEKQPARLRAGTRAKDPASASPDLSVARKYLVDRMGMAEKGVADLPPAQVLVLYIVDYFKEYRDEVFKVGYLPYAEGRVAAQAAEKRLTAAPDTEAVRFAREFAAAIHKVMAAQNRIDRKVAALRVIEALRIYAAAHDGRLPDTLSQVTEVPVPDDPGTAKPFDYRKDGETATLTRLIPGVPRETSALRYRLTVRKS
jgi:hypothetical protein